MSVNLIVAVDSKNGISRNNIIPWFIKEDMQFFSDITRNSAVIMGRITWESLKQPLNNRVNIVVSSTQQNTHTKKTLLEAINLAKQLECKKIFLIGGSKIYTEGLELNIIKNVYITYIHQDFNCDNFFVFNAKDWHKHINLSLALKNRNTNTKIIVNFIKYAKKPKKVKPENQYLSLLQNVLQTGDLRKTRNAKTWSVFGKTLEFDISESLPVLTTKRMFVRGIFEELLFFLRGDTNTNNLSKLGINIWESNTSTEFLQKQGLNYKQGDMGPMYGFNWNHYGTEYTGMDSDYTGKGFNQINYCLNLLKTDPNSRRILLTSYNPQTAQLGCLFCCHSVVLQFYVEKNHKLSMCTYNRSQDAFLGLPFNLTMAALIIYIFCELLNNDINYTGPKFTPGRLIMNLGDVHIYKNHRKSVITQLLRTPHNFPKLTFTKKITSINDLSYNDILLTNYKYKPAIKTNMTA